ncbi:MAG: RDD family protein [Terracidiphilus sp.]
MNASSDPSVSASAWKQEIHRRIAAHNSRRSRFTAALAAPAQPRIVADSRAAQAAARVAARYAHAPSYSQLQTGEIAGTDSGTALSAVWEREPEAEPASAAPAQPAAQPQEPIPAGVEPQIACGPLPGFEASESAYPVLRQQPEIHMSPEPEEKFWDVEPIEPVEPDQPIAANLIEFPRELVAARKVRPRLAEGAFAFSGTQKQLSIFEVDPAVLSIQPETAEAVRAPEWSGIELEAQPRDESETEIPAEAPVLHLAPMGNRLMALLVDGALITGAFLAAARIALAYVGRLPALKVVECGTLAVLVLLGLLYQTLFLALGEATPGMRYADISLCTFDGQRPTRAQLRSRLGALLLSVLSMGMGMVWMLFDDDHLSWHDRLSKTYLRR